jgi:hypothetical protein
MLPLSLSRRINERGNIVRLLEDGHMAGEERHGRDRIQSAHLGHFHRGWQHAIVGGGARIVAATSWVNDVSGF